MKSRRNAPASEQQLLLPGIDAPPPPLRTRSRATPGERAPRKPPPAHVLFFAIHPGEEDAARIAAWSAQWHAERDLRAMHVEPDRLHVTLHDLGEHDELPRDKVELAIAAASRLHLPRFEVAFDSAMRFAKGACVLLGGENAEVAALAAFRQRLGEVLADAGFAPKRAFTPHLTLSYMRGAMEPATVEPVRWTAASFALIDSRRAEGVHEVLGRWALPG